MGFLTKFEVVRIEGVRTVIVSSHILPVTQPLRDGLIGANGRAATHGRGV